MVCRYASRVLPTPFHYPADGHSSVEALLKALDDLDSLFVAIDDEYKRSLREDSYERWEEQT